MHINNSEIGSDKKINDRINNISLAQGLLWFFVIMGVVAIVRLCYVLDEQFKTRDKKIEQLTKIIQLQEQYRDTSYLIPVIEGMVNILSNQTQSIKDLKNMIDIQIMSTGDCELPAMKKMQPSTNNVKGVDLLSELLSANDEFFKAFTDHPWHLN